MKIQLKPIIASILLTGVVSSPAMAASKQALEASVAQLQREVNSLKTQINTNTAAISEQNSPHAYQAHAEQASKNRSASIVEYMPFDPDVPGQAYVSTGPYVGINIQFAGNNLIVNSPYVNTDVQLLSIRKKIVNQLATLMGESIHKPAHSHLLFSGIIESQANYTNWGGAPSTTDIDLTNVSLDATIFGPSEWILGFIDLTYDGTSPKYSPYTATSNYRVSNSRIFVNRAFVTLGNFNCSPFYTTFGQFYVPFGVYSSVMISEPLTKIITRIKARSVLVGMQQQSKNAFYAAAYIFRGDSHANSVPKVSNGGINLGYKFNLGFVNGNIGGGVVGNIADSAGMQIGVGFQNNEQIVHRVPGYNIHAMFNLSDHIDLIAEYVTASTKFNPIDMSYNGSGATPKAYDLEAAYSFPLFDNRPSSIGIGYSKSNEALAINIPMSRTYVVFNTSLRRNTLQSLEFRHDRQYAASSYATGAGSTTLVQQQGKPDNAITAQFDYYF
jgi:hypothetical protein